MHPNLLLSIKSYAYYVKDSSKAVLTHSYIRQEILFHILNEGITANMNHIHSAKRSAEN